MFINQVNRFCLYQYTIPPPVQVVSRSSYQLIIINVPIFRFCGSIFETVLNLILEVSNNRNILCQPVYKAEEMRVSLAHFVTASESIHLVEPPSPNLHFVEVCLLSRSASCLFPQHRDWDLMPSQCSQIAIALML